ncbi:MAG: DnaJ domain-containing protein [Bacteroidetes bacterium]|nr:DnaJ domain-containing protein [Bacteroidota bacterium]
MNTNEALNILQLHRPVTLNDIKKAYRKLALQYHPDINSQNESEQFISILKAYEFLNSKTESEINNIHHFKVTKSNRGPVIIPDSLLFADIENLFYIFHFLNRFYLPNKVFNFLYRMIFLPRNTSNLFKFLQIFLGILFTFLVFPFFIGAFIILTIPYISYELFYEKMRSIYTQKTKKQANKYSADLGSKLYFLSIRVIPSLLVLFSVIILLQIVLQFSQNILLLFMNGCILTILFFWILSIGRDVYISLNRKA